MPIIPGLEALRAKYQTIQRMRREDQQGLADDPKPQMRALADRFPGALRELDELPMEAIESRLMELDEAIAGRREPPPWAVMLVAYHGWMRAVLRVRRLGRGAETLAELGRRVRGGYHPEPDEPAAALFDDALLRAVQNPPRGRLNDLVYERLAERYGLDVDSVVRTLFPYSHQRVGPE